MGFWNKKAADSAAAGNIAATAAAAGAAYATQKVRQSWARRGASGYKRKRTYTKTRKIKRYKRRAVAPSTRVNKAISSLKRRVESGMGTYVQKRRGTDAVVCGVNGTQHDNLSFRTTEIEAAIDSLPVFNPSSPGTYTFVNFTSGTQQKEVEISSVYTYCLAKNNYNVPVRCTIYLCIPRVDTTITPVTAMTNGLTDMGSGLGSTTAMITPRDSIQFNDLWRVKYKVTKELVAGQTMKASYRTGSFQYDPSLVDSHTSTFQRAYKGHSYLVRVEGVLGHDTTADQQGFLAAGVDVVKMTIITVKYEAGADIKYLEVVDDASGFTNGGVVSSYSDVAKESYSVN